MADKKKKNNDEKMLSLRREQHDRIVAISKKEKRSMRTVVGRMLDMYENKG